MELSTILLIISGVLTGAAALFANKYAIVKTKLGQVRDLIKEGSDIISVAVAALDDDKLSSEEVAAIKKEAQEAVAAFKALIGKSA